MIEQASRWPLRRSRFKRFFYGMVRTAARIAGVCTFSLRCLDRHRMDVEGGALVLCTHQSTLDPVLVGLSYNGRLNYLARRTLFKNRLFSWLITTLDAIEVDRDRSGLSGLKETLKRLKRGEKVLIFPEGTRSSDGKLQPLKRGFISVARRSSVPLIPIAVDGAFQSLQRGAKLPRQYPLHLAVGQVMSAQEVSQLSDEELLAALEKRFRDCIARINQQRSYAPHSV